MRKYDKPFMVKSKYGIQSVVGKQIDESMFWFLSNDSSFSCYVECRKCRNLHNIISKCQVCGSETKVFSGNKSA